MNSQLRTADLIVLLVYMLGVFALGCWFARKSGSTKEFMSAGSALPGWAVGLSIFGTYVSSIGFLGAAGNAYSGNWNSWVFGLSLPIAAVIAVRYFVPMYRSRNAVSAYAQLEERFGPWARIYALVCYLLTQFARIGTILYLVALAFAALTGWEIKTIIVVTGVLVTVYTLLGGIEAVIWTDVAQSIVLIGGTILCVVVLLFEMPAGPGQLFEIANASDKFSLGSFSLNPESIFGPDSTFWIVLMYGIFINLQNFGIDQSFVQRYITAKSDKDATFSVWLGAIMFPVISVLFFFIGTGLFSLYHADTKLLNEIRAEVEEGELRDSGVIAPTKAEVEAKLAAKAAKLADVAEKTLTKQGAEVTEAAVAAKAEELWDKEIGDKVLPHFIVKKLPIGLAGLLIAAIFAAAMSSMDTSLNSSASLVLCDIYQRYINPDIDERQSMKVLYGSTLLFGVIGTLTGVALAILNNKSALDMWWNLQGIFAGGMLGLFLLGMISRRARNPHAAIAGTIGIFIIAWLALSPISGIWPETWSSWKNPLHKNMTIIVGTSSIVLIGTLLGSLAAGSKVSDKTTEQK